MEQRLFKICTQCSASIVNSGISEVVTPPPDFNHFSCGEEYEHSIAILSEGGVEWVYDKTLTNSENYERCNKVYNCCNTGSFSSLVDNGLGGSSELRDEQHPLFDTGASDREEYKLILKELNRDWERHHP